LVAAYPARAQTVTTGTISGIVKDAQGGVLPRTLVTATNRATGLMRSAQTEDDGTYAITLLPPGLYRVEAEMGGLGKGGAPNVEVLLGNSTKVDIAIVPQVSETVVVVATIPVVDTKRSATAASVTNEEIENLPILGRDFRSLASLTPGIVSAFGSRVTADGARGISTDYNIDGATSNNDFFGENTGGTRAPFTFSQAAIKEFQVIRSQYDAEYGRGVGAQLNAITKSGTNEFHGEAFAFRRNKGWAATRPTTLSDGQTVVDSFLPKDSTQPGFVLGGPIVRDKAFFLVNFDGQRQKQPNTITDIHQRPEFLALTPAVQQQFIGRLESFLGHPYANELGYDTTFNQNTYLAKIDLNLAAKSLLSVRDNYTNFENANNQSLGNLSNQGTENDKFNQLVAQATTTMTDRFVNDLLVEYLKDQRPIQPVSQNPEIQLTGFSPTQIFGQNDFLPNNTIEDKWQLRDTLHYFVGRHSFKVGTDLLFMHIDNLFPRNLSGVYLYNTVQSYLDASPNSYRQGYGPGGGVTSWTQNTYGFYANDSIRVNPNVTIDLGLRYDWQTMPLPETNAFPQHPEFITQIKEDKNNVAPRLGVAVDLLGDGRSVIRGGVGKFFGYMPDILLSNPLTQISGNFNQVTLTCAAATTIKCPTFPNILTPVQFGQLARVSTDIVTVSPTYQAQEAWRTSIQFEKQVGKNYSASIGGIYSKLTNVQGSRNINAVANGFSLGNLPLYDLQSPNRLYTDMGVVRELCSCEEASFKSLTLETHRLASSDSPLSWDLSYTLSSAVDEETNERSTSTSFLYDPLNPALSRGPSDNDIRHRFGGGAIYRLPWKFRLAGLFAWSSGVPYTGGLAFTGVGIPGVPTSLGGLSQTTGNIPFFVDSSGNTIDLGQANNFSRQQLSNFLSSQGARIVGRNTFRQPSFHTIDLRLSKTFDLRRGTQVEFLAEVFNLLNSRIESVSGNNQNLGRVTYTQATDRYTFTSFASTFGLTNSYGSPDPRQLQVAAKFRF
jgi:hypothetical protein